MGFPEFPWVACPSAVGAFNRAACAVDWCSRRGADAFVFPCSAGFRFALVILSAGGPSRVYFWAAFPCSCTTCDSNFFVCCTYHAGIGWLSAAGACVPRCLGVPPSRNAPLDDPLDARPVVEPVPVASAVPPAAGLPTSAVGLPASLADVPLPTAWLR